MCKETKVVNLSDFSRARNGALLNNGDLLDGFERVRPVIRDVQLPSGKIITESDMREYAQDIINNQPDFLRDAIGRLTRS